MQQSLLINQSEYSLIQNYLRLDLDRIKFDGQGITNKQCEAYLSLSKKLNSIDFDLFD